MSFVPDLKLQFEKFQCLGLEFSGYISKYNEFNPSVFCLKASFFSNVGSPIYRA